MGNSTVGHLPPLGQMGMGMRPELPESSATYDGCWPQTVPEFERLVDVYLDSLVRFACRRLRNVQDAEDVVQNVLTAAFRDRRKRRKVTAVGPYLYRSVANACTDRLRIKNYSAVFREEVDIEMLLMGDENPSELAAAADEWRRAIDLLGRLPKDQAEVVRLRVFDEMRLSEIAAVIGCSVNTVCSKLRYGFKKLRSLMAEYEE
jgi:RNA polymerase sigma-70 factor (ECF subfamily)